MVVKRDFSETVVGGWLLLFGGIFLFAARTLIAVLPQVPVAPNEILAWVGQNSWPLDDST
jgi:hypothetical protein